MTRVSKHALAIGLALLFLASHGQAQESKIPLSSNYKVTVGGKPTDVYRMVTRWGTPMYFATADIDGPVTVDVEIAWNPKGGIRNVSTHPRSLQLKPVQTGSHVSFAVQKTGSVTLLVNDNFVDSALHIFLNPPVEPPPANAVVFAAGYHDLGYDHPIRLNSGQTLYLAPGAWVEGIIRVSDAKDVRIMGRGVLSQRQAHGKDYMGATVAPMGIIFKNCRDLSVEGIIQTRGIGGWNVFLQNCDNALIRGFHVVSSAIPSGDGINPANSRQVTIEKCFIRSGDDSVAIKGNTGPSMVTHPNVPPSEHPPVDGITVADCTLWSDHNAVLVIGCETRAEYFRNITFRNIDIIRSFGGTYLGVFNINSLHGTDISQITYENIRVEHCHGPHLFDFRFFDEIFKIPGNQSFPGRISDVTIRNITVSYQKDARKSVFKGYAPEKRVERVTIENLRYGSEPVTKADDMGLEINEHVSGVRFIP
jgi:hypothetical protein